MASEGEGALKANRVMEYFSKQCYIHFVVYVYII